MKFEILRNEKGEPVSVKMSYKDWMDLVTRYGINPGEDQITGLDWYAKRESANSILYSLIAYCDREILKEEEREDPDQEKIAFLDGKSDELQQILRSPGTFGSIRAMNAIIEKYGPEIKAINTSSFIL